MTYKDKFVSDAMEIGQGAAEAVGAFALSIERIRHEYISPEPQDNEALDEIAVKINQGLADCYREIGLLKEKHNIVV